MPIKVQVSEKQEEKETVYPILMENEEGKVVLFTKERTGTVVHGPTRVHYLGYWSESWYMGVFKPFNREITLSNDS